MKKLDEIRDTTKKHVDSVGNVLVELFHYIGLFIIGGVVCWASYVEILNIIATKHFNVESILLLFIYLELGAMVGIYFKTNHLPIRFLLYIGITAMTRHLIGLITDHATDTYQILLYCVGIFLLCVAVLIVRVASFKFPSWQKDGKSDIDSQ